MRCPHVVALAGLALIALGLSCQAPDEISVSAFGSSGHSDIGDREFGLDTNNSGGMLTLTWAMGKRREAFRNLAALDVSKAGQLTLRDDHHAGAAPPVTVVVEAEEPEPEPEPERGVIATLLLTFTKVPETLDEGLRLGILATIIAGLLLVLKRTGILDRFIPSKKDPKP